MRKVVLGLALSLSFASMTTLAAEDAGQTGNHVTDTDCTGFNESLANQIPNITAEITRLLGFASCAENETAMKIVQKAVELTITIPAADAAPLHQAIMQATLDANIAPKDETDSELDIADEILLAAIAGGGDILQLIAPSAGIIPGALTPPTILSGLNGGTGTGDSASIN